MIPAHLDTQIKQRLTGAAVLVVLAVLLIPELLTGPKARAPTSSSSTVANAVDDDAGSMRSVNMDLRRDAATPASSAARPEAAAETSAPAESAAPVPANEMPARAEAAAKTPAGEPSSTAVPSTSVSENAEPSAEVATAVEPMSRREPLRVATGSAFAVQLGSFASRASADRVATEAGRSGFSSFVSPVDRAGKRLYRVRVGPVATRADAQALAKRLASSGHKGAVVADP